jgi:hypothetical protein
MRSAFHLVRLVVSPRPASSSRVAPRELAVGVLAAGSIVAALSQGVSARTGAAPKCKNRRASG